MLRGALVSGKLMSARLFGELHGLNGPQPRALFVVLQDATKDMRNLEGDELGERAKYAELVMKVSSLREIFNRGLPND